MDNFYRENILDHYKNPRNFGKLSNPDVTHEENNPLCGDKIGMDVKLKVLGHEKTAIENIHFFGVGCAISLASASMLTELAKGKDSEDIKKLKSEDILKLLSIELTPTRLKCALLPLEVLQKALVKK